MTAASLGDFETETGCKLMLDCSADPKTQVQVRVELQACHCARALPAEYEAVVEETWLKKVTQNPKLFNGTKFRLRSVASAPGALTLHLGLTDYRSFLGTNWSPRCDELKEAGRRDHDDSSAYLAHPLGVGAVLETSDGYLCFIQRSQYVGEYPGFLDCPGGHPEPQAIGIGVEGLQQLQQGLPLVADKDPSIEHRASEEFFSSILEEVVGEVNLDRRYLAPPRLLGICEQCQSGGRPSAAFHIEVALLHHQVQDLYAEGGAEKEESTRLACIPVAEAMAWTGPGQSTRFTPATLSCLWLWRKMKKS